MKRVSTLTLGLLFPLVAFACSSEPDTGGPTNNTPTSGVGNTAGGSGGQASTAGASTGGAAGAAGAATGGVATGGGGAATGGATTGGGGAATAGGGAGGATTGGGGAGGAATGGGGAGGANGACPAKIDTKTVCTQIVSCPGTKCGIHKLGLRDCSCAAATGVFSCTSCTFAGAEAITVKPATPLTKCTQADSALEDVPAGTCTSGERCEGMADANRFCACWDDPARGGLVWDCDSVPSAWK